LGGGELFDGGRPELVFALRASAERQLTPPGGVGGRRGIRTPEPLSGLLVFKTSAINHSAILPCYIERHKVSIRTFFFKVMRKIVIIFLLFAIRALI
jgi:hypothetical protein